MGSKKAMQAELEQLRELVDGFGYGQRRRMEAELAALSNDLSSAQRELAMTQGQLEATRAKLVVARDEAVLQDVGIYDYHHPLEDSVAYKLELDETREEIKSMARADGGAVIGGDGWTVNGSATEGRKMVKQYRKLLLRAYNNEADTLVGKMKPYKLDAAVDRLDKSRNTITKLAATMGLQISDRYHWFRVRELQLTADYINKKQAEKDLEREERARLREEARARKEFEQEKKRLFKERSHYESVLERIRQNGTASEIAAAEQRMQEIDEAISGVEEREANIRAGYVYVISNVGAFGGNVIKIGMTRRLEPMDRVRELGDASVPFRYDVHAVIFSKDAVTLEAQLHAHFEDRRVNLVNRRREFFYATPVEVEEALRQLDGSLLEFIEEPEAEEWHQSENSRRQAGAEQ